MDVKEFIEKNKERIEDELKEYISYKSISTDFQNHKEDFQKAQEFIIKQIESLGGKTEIIDTQGIPAIYGEIIKDPKLKTVLIYGHYDVQPAKKEDGWEQEDPFKLTEKEGRWYARGISDNKGPHFAAFKAVEFLKNDLPVNVKFIIEGEEEIGSENFPECIKKNKEKLAADLVIVSDGAWATNTNPTVEYGLRGMVSMFVRIDGPKKDIHSGQYGGAVKNPHIQLVNLLSKCVDDNGICKIPGFYEGVREINDMEKDMINARPLELKEIYEETGGEFTSQDKFEIIRRTEFAPTFEIHGISGGYTEEGMKNIVPSFAEAKIGIRTVPDQDPKLLLEKVTKFLKDNHPKVKVEKPEIGPYFFVEPDNPALLDALKLLEEVYGEKGLLAKSGGSIPITAELKEHIGDVIMPTVNRPDCGMHTPTENTVVDIFWKSIEFFSKYLQKLSK
jgi:acetylornithine deacetylase/succinyl-diaminopimelate desuccinylase-like protein